MPDEKKSNVAQQIRQNITDQIIKAMEIDLPPWRMPWLGLVNAGNPANFVTDKGYRGINVMLLMLNSMYFDMKSKYWGTLVQWSKMGAYVKTRPEGIDNWGTHIVYYNFIEKKQAVKKDKTQKIPFMRTYVVFNVEQVEAPNINILAAKTPQELAKIAKKLLGFEPSNLKPYELAESIHDAVDAQLDRFRTRPNLLLNNEPDFKPAEELINATKAQIIFGEDKAFYRKSDDKIRMPNKRQFTSITEYYETIFHELGHWSMAPKRLDLGRDTAYAFNELVVEISACFMAAELNVPLANEMLAQNMAYIKSWLTQMGKDPKFIFEASTVATKVTDYLLKFVNKDTAHDVMERMAS